MNNDCWFGILATALCLAATPATAARETGGESTIVYPAEFFARVQPVSAYDMVLLVPTFRLIEGDTSVRGYAGAAGNVLIDGQRPSSKEETLEAVLKRIPANRVARIELIRDGGAGYDMQGYAVLVNIVRVAGGRISGKLESGLEFNHQRGPAPRIAGQVTANMGPRVLEISAGIDRNIDDEHGVGRRDRFAGDGSAIRLVDYAQVEGSWVVDGSATYRQPLLGGSLSASALVRDERKFADIAFDITAPRQEPILGSERSDERAYEGGLHFEKDGIGAGKLELIVSYRAVREHGEDTETAAEGSERTLEDARSAEAIGRIAYRAQVGTASVEAGLEGALNSLDSTNLLFADEVPVPLPGASARVEEKRIELFANGSLSVSPRVMVEAGARYERSRLTQVAIERFGKSLAFFKPRAQVRWTGRSKDRVRVLVEREVGQLEFKNFVGNASVNGGTITAGNRDLEPESLWRVEASYERPVATGMITVAVRREWLSNTLDHLPVLADGTVYDAIGNIGSGRRDELEAGVNVPLDPVGLKGVTIRGDLVVRRGRVIDPTTLEPRRISKDKPLEVKLSFTHDIPAWRLRWGANFLVAREETAFKVAEIETSNIGDRLDAFVEYKPASGWSLRTFARNLTDSPALRIRDIYAGSRSFAPLKYQEIRSLKSGRYFGLSVQRSFGG